MQAFVQWEVKLDHVEEEPLFLETKYRMLDEVRVFDERLALVKVTPPLAILRVQRPFSGI